MKAEAARVAKRSAWLTGTVAVSLSRLRRVRSASTSRGADDILRVSREERLDVRHGAVEPCFDHLRRHPRIVRGEDDVGGGEERIAWGDGLLVEDVEPGPGDSVAPERGDEGVLIHQGGSRGIDGEGGGGHEGGVLLPDEIPHP